MELPFFLKSTAQDALTGKGNDLKTNREATSWGSRRAPELENKESLPRDTGLTLRLKRFTSIWGTGSEQTRKKTEGESNQIHRSVSGRALGPQRGNYNRKTKKW